MRFKIGVLLVLIVGSLSAEIRPIALSSVADDKLVGLDSSSALIFIDLRSRALQLVPIPGFFQVLDLTAAGQPEENLIFVLTRGKGTQLSPIYQLTPQGKVVRQWIVPIAYPSGVVLDYSRRFLYVSTLQDFSIYRIDLNDPKAWRPHYLTQVRGATRLGTLALDIAGNRLFVADVFSGKIYAISLTTLASSQFAANLGEPAALAIAPDGRTLYVADRAHRCIWAVRLNQPAPTPTLFWSSDDLREPLGIAVDASGTVWVADKSAKTIFEVARNGQEADHPRLQYP